MKTKIRKKQPKGLIGRCITFMIILFCVSPIFSQQLTISNRNFTVSEGSVLIISGNLKLEDTSDFQNKGNIIIRGDFINNIVGTSGMGGLPVGNFNFNGDLEQSIMGSMMSNFSNLTIDNPNGVFLKKNVIISDGLTFLNGKLFTGSTGKLIEIIDSVPPVITGPDSKKFIVTSKLGYVVLTSMKSFNNISVPVGGLNTPDTNYAPVTITVANVNDAPVNIELYTDIGPSPNENTPIQFSSGISIDTRCNHYWGINKSGSGILNSYKIEFDITNTKNTGNISKYIVKRFDNLNGWILQNSELIGNKLVVNGTGDLGECDFVIGEPLNRDIKVVIDTSKSKVDNNAIITIESNISNIGNTIESNIQIRDTTSGVILLNAEISSGVAGITDNVFTGSISVLNPGESVKFTTISKSKTAGIHKRTVYAITESQDMNILNNIDTIQFEILTVINDINLTSGWNLISTFVEPENKSMPIIWNNIKSFVNLVKNNGGQSYIPQFNINQIGNWNKFEGYQVSMNDTKILSISGFPIKPENTPIDLTTGWKIVSYLRNTPMLAPTALATLVSQNALTLCKNNAGQSYIPQFNINQIGNLQPGQGYQMNLSKNATLTYPANALGKASAGGEGITPLPKVLIPEYKITGNNSILLVQNDSPNGNEIGVYNQNDKLIGSGIFNQGIATVTIWGDDEQTEITDGAKINERLRIKNYDFKTGRLNAIELTDLIDIIDDKAVSVLTYSKDIFVMAKVENMKNSSNISVEVVPNPASNYIEIEFNTPDCKASELKIYSLEGKLIADISDKLVDVKSYKLTQNISNFTSGEYTVVLSCGNERAIRKIVVVK